MSKGVKIAAVFLGCFVACLCLAAHDFIMELLWPHDWAIDTARGQLRAIRALPALDRVVISLTSNGHTSQNVELHSPEDRRLIGRLVDSVKRMKVAGTDDSWLGDGEDALILCWKRADGHERDLRVYGDFYPERAPVVSRVWRSDDLARVVYSILRAKGVNPRAGPANVFRREPAGA